MMNSNKKWRVNTLSLNDFPNKDEAVDHFLNLYDFPALFETSRGFSKLDGFETVFMLDRLFEIKLVNNVWSIFCDDCFLPFKKKCEKVLSSNYFNIWEKLRRILTILSIPDNYSYQLLLGYSIARFIEELPDMKVSKDEPELLLRVYKYQVKYRDDSNEVKIYELCKDGESSRVNEFLKVARKIKPRIVKEETFDFEPLKQRTSKNEWNE